MIYDVENGDRGAVFVNGIEIEDADRCNTGNRRTGWIEFVRFDVGIADFRRCRVYGRTHFIPRLEYSIRARRPR